VGEIFLCLIIKCEHPTPPSSTGMLNRNIKADVPPCLQVGVHSALANKMVHCLLESRALQAVSLDRIHNTRLGVERRLGHIKGMCIRSSIRDYTCLRRSGITRASSQR